MMKSKKVLSITIGIISSMGLMFPVNADVDHLDIGDVQAKCAIVMDVSSGRILYSKNENKRAAMASTTKIMTSLITLEQDDLDKYFTIDPDAIKIEGTSMGLVEGDQVTLRTLAYGMLLPSGNDAAGVAAVRIAGSKEKFVGIMNSKAKELGCKNTHFVTPSGLDAENHYSTVRDMAIIARYALRNDNFAEICKQEYGTIEYGNPPYKRTLKNHNKLLKNYPYCIGIKTGYTEDAGKCLVSAAEKNGIKLIVVTLNVADMSDSHINIYERAFSKMEMYPIDSKLPVSDVKVVGGQIKGVPVKRKEIERIPIVHGEDENIKNRVLIKKFVYAPVKKGDVVGEIDYYIDDLKLATQPITATMTVERQKYKHLWEKLLGSIHFKK